MVNEKFDNEKLEKEREWHMLKQMEQLNGILEQFPHKIILSNRKDKTYIYKKIVIRQIQLKGKRVYQIERFTDKQVFHENIEMQRLLEQVFSYFPETYLQLNVMFMDNHEEIRWDFKCTKKGKLLSNMQRVAQKQITAEQTFSLANNRKKRYLLQEGKVIPPLVDLGIFTKEGKIVQSKYDKYKQINRFLELVEDVVKDYPKKDMCIIDFGCGKSYLTFVLYYYLSEVKGYPVKITGLDLKEDVIAHCNDTAKKYGYKNLHFEVGDINGYKADQEVDMVVTLHACDVATDYALYNAIQWNAGIILSVPCCQKEVNRQIQSDTFSLVTRYGIVKERMSALITDAIRGNALTYSGYETQLLEFVDFASSPKNILIRGVRKNVSAKNREAAKAEIEALTAEFHIKQTLLKLLHLQ